jgi:hypothetical protein
MTAPDRIAQTLIKILAEGRPIAALSKINRLPLSPPIRIGFDWVNVSTPGERIIVGRKPLDELIEQNCKSAMSLRSKRVFS